MHDPQSETNDSELSQVPPSLPEMPTAVVEPPQQSVAANHIYVERRRSAGRALLNCGLITLIAAIVIFVLLPLIGITISSGIVDGFVGILRPAPSIARTSSTQTIVTGIQPLGQLVTVSAQLAKADIHVGVQGDGLNACGFSANHVAEGTLEGGVDLAAVAEGDITFDALTDTYTVRLPAPQLTSCRIDFIRQYTRSTTVCNVDWDEARVLAQYVALIDFRDDAVEGGLLDRAKLESRLVLSNFIGALTGSNVTIVFDEPETMAVPPSCAPPVPDRWIFDEQSHSWTKQ